MTQAASDQGQLPLALDEIERNLGKLPEQVVGDGGFTSRETILEVAERQVDLIGGPLDAGSRQAAEREGKRRGMEPAFYPERFAYDAPRNTCTCPAGKELAPRGTRKDRPGVVRHLYQAQAADCQGCTFKPKCCPGERVKNRTVARNENVPAVAAWVAKMQTEAAKAIYRLRGAVAEFPNAWLKAKMGLRQFRVRGLKKVRCEALWACLTYNIQQWVRLRWRVQRAGVEA